MLCTHNTKYHIVFIYISSYYPSSSNYLPIYRQERLEKHLKRDQHKRAWKQRDIGGRGVKLYRSCISRRIICETINNYWITIINIVLVKMTLFCLYNSIAVYDSESVILYSISLLLLSIIWICILQSRAFNILDRYDIL